MKFKTTDKTYEVPTNWGAVKYKDFAQSQTKGLSLSKKLEYQTTIPETVINNFPLADVRKLITVVEFQDELPEFFDHVDLKVEVGNEAYIKLEQSRLALEKSDNQWLGVIQVAKIYTDVDISELSVIQAFGYAVFFLKLLTPSSQSTQR